MMHRVRIAFAIAILSAIPLVAQRVPADWHQVGKAGEWSETVAMAGMNGLIKRASDIVLSLAILGLAAPVMGGQSHICPRSRSDGSSSSWIPSQHPP